MRKLFLNFLTLIFFIESSVGMTHGAWAQVGGRVPIDNIKEEKKENPIASLKLKIMGQKTEILRLTNEEKILNKRIKAGNATTDEYKAQRVMKFNIAAMKAELPQLEAQLAQLKANLKPAAPLIKEDLSRLTFEDVQTRIKGIEDQNKIFNDEKDKIEKKIEDSKSSIADLTRLNVLKTKISINNADLQDFKAREARLKTKTPTIRVTTPLVTERTQRPDYKTALKEIQEAIVDTEGSIGDIKAKKSDPKATVKLSDYEQLPRLTSELETLKKKQEQLKYIISRTDEKLSPFELGERVDALRAQAEKLRKQAAELEAKIDYTKTAEEISKQQMEAAKIQLRAQETEEVAAKIENKNQERDRRAENKFLNLKNKNLNKPNNNEALLAQNVKDLRAKDSANNPVKVKLNGFGTNLDPAWLAATQGPAAVTKEIAQDGEILSLRDMLNRGSVHKQTIVPIGYAKLLFAMTISEAFQAGLSGDPQRWTDFIHSLVGVDFHLTMGMFEGSMGLSTGLLRQVGGFKARHFGYSEYSAPSFRPAPLDRASPLKGAAMESFQQKVLRQDNMHLLSPIQNAHIPTNAMEVSKKLSFLVLPMGDIITAYFSEVYNHPRMRAILDSYDQHKGVVNPDRPNDPPTNDPDLKRVFRQRMRVNFMKYILADLNKPESHFKKFYHGIQIGMVAKTYGTLQASKHLGLSVYGSKIKNGRIMLYKIAHGPKGLGLPSKVRIVKSINMPRLARAVKAAPGVFLWTGNALLTAGFFLVDAVISAVAMPHVESAVALTHLQKAERKLVEAVTWYLDPKRDETLPWSMHANEGKSFSWLKFFHDDSGKTTSKRYIDNNNKWHANKPYFYAQAFDFMKEFSENYMAEYLDPTSYEKCLAAVESPITLDVSYPMAGPCLDLWYVERKKDFVQKVQNFKPEGFVQARLTLLNNAYSEYRNAIILKDLSETNSIWTTAVAETINESKRKESWYLWIARGMREDDPHFVLNEEIWHIHPKDKVDLLKEKLDMIQNFDKEVLNRPFYKADSCAGGSPAQKEFCIPQNLTPMYWEQEILKHHNASMKEVAGKVKNFTLSDISSLIKVANPDAFASTDPVTQEVNQTRNRIMYNSFDAASDKESPLAEEMKRNALSRIARWLAAGMTNTSEFQKNEGEWHPTEPQKITEYIYDVVREFLTTKFFNTIPPRATTEDIALQASSNNNFNDNDTAPQATHAAHTAPAAANSAVAKDQGPDVGGIQQKRLTEALLNLYVGEGGKISTEDREHMGIIIHTYKWVNKHREELSQTLSEKKEKYHKVMQEALYAPGKMQHPIESVQRHFTIKDYYAKKYSKLEKGGDDASLWSVLSNFFNYMKGYQFITTETGRSTPAGFVNAYNQELRIYLQLLQNVIADRVAQNQKSPNIEKNLKATLAPSMKTTEPTFDLTNTAEKAGKLLTAIQRSMIGDPELKSNMAQRALKHVGRLFNMATTEISSVEKSDKLGAQEFVQTAQGYSKLIQMVATPLVKEGDEASLQNAKNLMLEYTEMLSKEDKAKREANFLQNKTWFLNQADLQVRSMVDMLKRRGSSEVNSADERALFEGISDGKFAIPLMAATQGENSLPMRLIYTLGSHVTNVTNQKTIYARVGCYLLKDPICSSSH
ncbi:MAG: hypothetical protein SGI74_04730 [Oligoflexia bacterium]|nr:hypothetical protein [Oligoflexia bacterium]